MKNADVVIIGGGLAGLATAHQLEDEGLSWQLLEARERWGGRILSHRVGDAQYDLGPSWFWPGQPRMAALMTRFGQAHFDQAWHGDPLYEDAEGAVHRGQGFASMRGAFRPARGFSELIAAMVSALPAERMTLNAAVRRLSRTSDGVDITVSSGDVVTAKSVILALPPRLAADLEAEPAWSVKVCTDMAAVPTWMAGQAKCFALFDKPFWREAGLSGDVSSRRGPLVEIHDASPQNGGPAALFGFIGVPAAARAAHSSELTVAIRSQLLRLFGPVAASPQDIVLQDWAREGLTSVVADRAPLRAHPDYRTLPSLGSDWDDYASLGSTETGGDVGGYLEGALAAAHRVSQRTISKFVGASNLAFDGES